MRKIPMKLSVIRISEKHFTTYFPFKIICSYNLCSGILQFTLCQKKKSWTWLATILNLLSTSSQTRSGTSAFKNYTFSETNMTSNIRKLMFIVSMNGCRLSSKQNLCLDLEGLNFLPMSRQYASAWLISIAVDWDSLFRQALLQVSPSAFVKYWCTKSRKLRMQFHKECKYWDSDENFF